MIVKVYVMHTRTFLNVLTVEYGQNVVKKGTARPKYQYIAVVPTSFKDVTPPPLLSSILSCSKLFPCAAMSELQEGNQAVNPTGSCPCFTTNIFTLPVGRPSLLVSTYF